MKKIDDFFNKHENIFDFIFYVVLAFVVRKNQVYLAAVVGMCGGYFTNFIIKKVDKVIDFIKSEVLKK